MIVWLDCRQCYYPEIRYGCKYKLFVREAAKKSYLLNGSAIKGGKGLANKKEKPFLGAFFLFVEKVLTAIKLEGGGLRL